MGILNVDLKISRYTPLPVAFYYHYLVSDVEIESRNITFLDIDNIFRDSPPMASIQTALLNELCANH